MDELEYILGDASTTYGALRISHGYTAPLRTPKYIEVGNEEYV